MKRKRAIVVALLGIPIAYVLAYAILVEPVKPSSPSGWTPWPMVAQYRMGGAIADCVFMPVNWLDRTIRKRTWLQHVWDVEGIVHLNMKEQTEP